MKPALALLLLALFDPHLEFRQEDRPPPGLGAALGTSNDGPVGHGTVELDKGRAALGAA